MQRRKKKSLVRQPDVPELEVGVVGLGHIGGNVALNALEEGIRVVGSSRRPPGNELLQAGLIDAGSVARLPASLSARPRRILLYVPAGVTVDEITQAVMQLFAVRDGDRYWARAIAMMRNGFGSHPLGPDEETRRLRKTARVADAQELANEDGEPARH